MQSHSISDPGDRGGRLRLAEEEDLLSSPTPEPGPQPKGLGPLATQIEGNKLPRNGPTIALELLREDHSAQGCRRSSKGTYIVKG